MSLFGSIRMAANSLRANQIAMQVIGQNIANANTPGYIREETILSPAPTQRMGNLLLGLGVQVDAVVQKIDNFLEERLRGAVSDESDAAARESTYTQLEEMIGELSETDISTAMTTFFNGIAEILNQPENVSVRNLAVLNARTLTQEINRLATRVREVRADLNSRIITLKDDINRLAEEIRVLNVRISETEGGSVSKSDAVGLRDQRLMALEELAKLVNIRVREQPTGSVTVYVGGDYLVADGFSRPVKLVLSSDRGLTTADIHFEETDSPLDATSGEYCGLKAARDDVLGGFLDKLDDFAGTLAFEFNKIFSSGQGLHGYSEVTSQSYVTDADAPLDQAGLKFTPVNGAFQIMVYNTQDKTTQTIDVPVHLLGDDTDTTLQTLSDALGQIGALSVTVAPDGRLSIASKSANNEFAFANDTSGILAALGINTLFTGSTATDLAVNEAIAGDPAKFAASRGGIGLDTENAVELVAFPDKGIASHNNASISVIYDRLVAETTQGSTVTHAEAEGARVFEQTLRGEKLATSGVSLDEEAISMIAVQKSFQASARFIAVLSELLDLLVSI